MEMEVQKRFVFYTKGIECKSFYDEKAKKKRYFLKGHIDSEDLDLVNDIVTKSCMVDIQDQFNARTIKLDLDHETLRKGKGESDFDVKLNLTKIPLGKAISETLDVKGNLIEFELNSNWKKLDAKNNIVMTFKEVWDNLKSGFYDAFSIAYVPIRTVAKALKEGKARLLEKVNIINVAVTGNAINPAATITNVMAKSLEYLKELEEKGYDKDGAHAHTENEPLGIHNHTEIEKTIQSEVEYLSDRMGRISDRLYKLESGTPESETGLKGNKKNKSGDKKMVEKDKETKPDEAKPQDQGDKPDNADQGAPESGSQDQGNGGEAAPDKGGDAPAEGGEGGKPAAEKKSIDAKAFTELKGTVDSLAKSVEKINTVLEKALPAGYGAENLAEKGAQTPTDTKSHVIGTMDLI